MSKFTKETPRSSEQHGKNESHRTTQNQQPGSSTQKNPSRDKQDDGRKTSR